VIPASKFLEFNMTVSVEQFQFGIPSFVMVFNYKMDHLVRCHIGVESYFLDAELNVDDSLETNVGNVIDVCVQMKVIYEKGAWLWGQRRPWSC
jgi:hypothetical protein